MFTAKTDASLREASGIKKSGIGYVIYKDNIPIRKCRMKQILKNSNDLEYIAVLELLKDIKILGIKNIIIYTDSKNLVDYLNKDNQCKNIKNEFIQDILYRLNLNPSIKILWIPRNLNKDAHKLSRQSTSGKRNIKDLSKLVDIKDNRDRHETKMVIRYRSSIMLKCPSCKEFKQASEYPRYKSKTKIKRNCKSCEMKIRIINNNSRGVKNT
ncbi:ribonuclease H family protein [Paenibacillus pini]|uniref:RNase H type-1 domain-containing protein n=1 Tax=Paenibacillus pini JCM 16418 TaxID=1236976 RepID=W7Z0A1_9BACL|nr:ribonuclease H family protein [Paenibacillus pini]GAF10381.1 hypothetical protein JCM16418_4580 [Paenibacillus pini JCM 16418]